MYNKILCGFLKGFFTNFGTLYIKDWCKVKSIFNYSFAISLIMSGPVHSTTRVGVPVGTALISLLILLGTPLPPQYCTPVTHHRNWLSVFIGVFKSKYYVKGSYLYLFTHLPHPCTHIYMYKHKDGDRRLSRVSLLCDHRYSWWSWIWNKYFENLFTESRSSPILLGSYRKT